MASAWEGLSFAPTGTMFTVSPTWVRIDTGDIYDDGVRVSRIDISRGRQSEFDKVDTGTMTVTLTDRGGVFDPSNTGSDYYGLLIRKPIAFAMRNPVTDVWWSRFRGVIQEIGYGMTPTQQAGEIVIRCVDWMDYLANFELAPGHGDYVNAQVNTSGFVFYEDTDFQTRLVQLAEDASVPVGLTSFFTGNVDVLEGRYSPGESILTAFQDACDAEFPTIAQLYADKTGFLVGHGRFARLTPDSVASTSASETGHAWDFNRWEAGDGAGILLDSGRAQIRPPYGFSQSVEWIRNAALAYPQAYSAAERAARMPTQALFETGSISTFGTRSWSAENLLLLEGTTTSLDAWDECVLYEQFILDNYSALRNRIDQITFKSLNPTDTRAASTWALMTRVDISDIVQVQISHPGGGGFIAEDFFVEGVHETHTPLHKDLDTGWPLSIVSLNLSPQSYYSDASAFS